MFPSPPFQQHCYDIEAVSISEMAYKDLWCLESACSDFHAFCKACDQIEGRWGISTALRVSNQDSMHFRSQVDKVFCWGIIPANFRGMKYVPVIATGDGNCLFNSASLAICQAETLAVELWLRTCIELAKNRQFYRNHPVLVNCKITYCGKNGPGVMSVETLCNLTCFSSSSTKFMVIMSLKQPLTVRSWEHSKIILTAVCCKSWH